MKNRILLNTLVIIVYLFLPAVLRGEIRSDPIAMYLTWQHDPTTTMTVQWVSTSNQTEDEVFYRKENESIWSIAIGVHAPFPYNEPFMLHRLELTNLQPDSVYVFHTGWASKEYKFQTMPSTLKASLRFVEGGDMYHDDIKSLVETNRQAAAHDPSFALVGGDIAYAAASKASKWTSEKRQRWIAWLTAWDRYMVNSKGCSIPVVPTIGNHDVDIEEDQSSQRALFFYFLFPFPGIKGYNALDFGNYLSVIALDTDHTHPVEGIQTYWLYDALRKRESMPNKFAFYHVPAYPSHREYKGKISSEIRKYWVPIFEEFGLSAAFEHHDHTYKRTYPLYRGKRDMQRGVVYLGDGAWGIKQPRKPRKPSKDGYLAQTASRRHFILVTLTPECRSYQAIDYSGSLIDYYIQNVRQLILESKD